MSNNPLKRLSFAAFALLLLAGLLASGCATAPAPAEAPAKSEVPTPADTAEQPKDPNDAYLSTYKPLPSSPVLITNATILTAAGDRIEGGSILLQDGRIAAVGRGVQAPAGAITVDATGKWVTPGLIDAHSHLGVYPSPGDDANADGNEMTNPVTAEVWAEHSVWPQDPQFPLSLAGGVTAMLILPGSANLIGGRSVTVKNLPAQHVNQMKFPDAPYGLKMACGENPKRVYGEKGRAPSTRMGNVAGYRRAWIDAGEYRRQWNEHRERQSRKKESQDQDQAQGAPAGGDRTPVRDLSKETLAGVLDGEILVQNHCYRADEMLTMIDIAREFGYKITTFHHAVEAYKIADVLAREGICSAIWADSWGFKMEALDGIVENAAILQKAGACVVIHSDSAQVIQRLNQEAGKAMGAGLRMGLDLRAEDVIRWITINPAKSMGIDDQTGSLEVGKMADVVVWSGDPFSVYSRAEKVYIDGGLAYDRNDPSKRPRTDFELGLVELEDAGGER
ncbi:MAG TPA: amidohydrolase [Thermoanaerobaculia bacterium]|nr:amidohydrolase [Thermoanaerobaculia bacterium]